MIQEATGPIDDPVLRASVALYDVDAIAFSAMSERFVDELKAGRAHPAQSSMMKFAGSELSKRKQELLMSAVGAEGLAWDAAGRGSMADPRLWLRSKGFSMAGGTSAVTQIGGASCGERGGESG